LNFRIIRNDIKKSKLITAVTVLFVAAAAMLVSLAAILIVNLAGSIDTLMAQAKTPHFLQMHAGELDRPRLDTFARGDSRIDDYQVLDFLNLTGNQIAIGDRSLADSLQDNGVSIQSERFDFLLDLDGEPIQPHDGELYVPLSYMKDGTARVGDTAIIAGKQLRVAGFLRDSQMNSTLSSSKRFLVSESDYAAMQSAGSVEYLIEFRLKDLSTLGAFEADYSSAGLESNGPTITYPLFRMINALTDGLMIAILILVSILVVVITFLCIRFTLLAKIEQDIREIGVMKAIGLRVSDIKKIYLAKYTAIALIGAVIGYALALIFQGPLSENIRLYMGTSDIAQYAPWIGIAGIIIVFLVIVSYVNVVLNRLRKISATRAIRFGDTLEKTTAPKRLRLSTNSLLSVNAFLGVQDILVRKKLFVTMLLILFIASIIMVIPQNIASTISDKSFISYLGIGQSDVIINIRQTDDIATKANAVEQYVARDSAIDKHVMLVTKVFPIEAADGMTNNVKIELGDHRVFPVAYVEGAAPVGDDEIALSSLNATDLGKNVGDTLKVYAGGNTKDMKISGIYSDVTNGGKTAKASFSDESSSAVWSIVYVSLIDKNTISEKATEYEKQFSYAKVSDVETHTSQIFGGTIASVETASRVTIAVALGLSFLITVLFMKMLVAKDRRVIAILKSCGFTRVDVVKQYVTRTLCITMIAIIAGTLVANTLGAWLMGLVMSQIGATSVGFVINPLLVYCLFPLSIIVVVLSATVIATTESKHSKISENIKE